MLPANAVSSTPTPSPVVPLGCAPDYGYETTGTGTYKYDMVPPAYRDPGQTLSISITAGLSVTGSIGGSVEGDESVIFATAKETVNASIAVSLTASVTYSASKTVPSGVHWGEEHAGATQQRFSWDYGHLTSACHWVKDRTGTGHEPYHIPSFWMTTG